MNKSLKDRAEEIMASIDHDVQRATEAQVPATLAKVDSKADAIMKTVFGIVSDVDIEAASERVRKLAEEFPEASPQELSQKLIREKCQRTGAVGAATSGTGLIPGLGTAAALTLGVAADIGATFKLQAELVLEIAAVYSYPLTEQEKQQVVMLITGLSVGTAALARRAGQTAAFKIGERFTGRAFLKALPVVGVIGSAGTNVLSTYIIGQRADAYFRLGPEAVGSWGDSVRAITGVDERKIGHWLAEGGKVTGLAVAAGAGKIGQAGKVAGQAITDGTGRVTEAVGPAISSGAKKAGDTAKTGARTYIWWAKAFWTTLFRMIGKIIGLIWAVATFVPRKIVGLLKRKRA